MRSGALRPVVLSRPERELPGRPDLVGSRHPGSPGASGGEREDDRDRPRRRPELLPGMPLDGGPPPEGSGAATITIIVHRLGVEKHDRYRDAAAEWRVTASDRQRKHADELRHGRTGVAPRTTAAPTRKPSARPSGRRCSARSKAWRRSQLGQRVPPRGRSWRARAAEDAREARRNSMRGAVLRAPAPGARVRAAAGTDLAHTPSEES